MLKSSGVAAAARRGQEGSTGDKAWDEGASAQDPLSLEIQGGGVITEPLMLDGGVLRGLGEREKILYATEIDFACFISYSHRVWDLFYIWGNV